MLEFRLAEQTEVKWVLDFYENMIEQMQTATYRPAWEKGVYPSEAFLSKAAQEKQLYLLIQDGQLVGAMVMNHHCAEGYHTVEWEVDASPDEVMVIHALGILPTMQGKGLARHMVREAIRTAREAGQKAIRLDAVKTNLPPQRLYTSEGFQYRGMFVEGTDPTEFLLYEFKLHP